MAYVPVPKDLTKVKSKFIFNLTKRQVICFGLGAVIGVPVFFLVKDSIGTSAATLLMIVLMLPFFLFAMYEKNGQHLKVVMKHFIESRFLRPKTRPYQTDNFYAAIDRSVRNRKEANMILYGKNKGKDQADTR